ncbi:4-coumarate-CoA ligase 1-like isoform X1 [Vespa crabro]|uniref:4-coumarate-CoA ligase 1-like isoform X1 n=1 Tax=Vespa crabro TaxID=7445 RepID=UPI001F019DF4|nr:4-coumarate-CoA ligase 1-like isoform X1 [Vespa crabro]XP_046823634.1 4-coumarate-CoA ligase 1-like isoform X1 [Vespa crabro]
MSIYRLLISRQGKILPKFFPSIETTNFSEYSSIIRVQRFLYGSSSSNQLSRLKLNSQNIVTSPFPDISGYENMLLHEMIWQNVEKWLNKTAIVCAITNRSYTYQQLRKYAGRLATSLRRAKLFPHDTVAIILPNVPEYAIIALALSEAGLRSTLINPIWTTTEIKKQLENSETSAIFTNPLLYSVVKKSIENNPRIKLPIIIVDDGSGSIPSGTINLNDFMRDDIEEFSKNQRTNVDPEDDVFLPYSSGTTGIPKGVQLSHRNITANILQISSPIFFPGINTNETEQDVVPIILPLFHIYGLIIILCNYLRMGAKLVCLPQFSIEQFIKILENYKPTLLYVVPTIVQMMVINEQITSKYFENVRHIMSGAATIGEESIRKFHEHISNKVRFTQGYGLTETSPAVILHTTDSINVNCESVGLPIHNTQLRIVKNEGDKSINVGPNEVGELYVKGPQVMKGYFKNSQATKDCMDGDWLKTGDIAKFDENGYFYIKGRIKELIKVKGFQVPPAELEDIIKGLDSIADVAVIGVPHEKFGEIPKAFIVLKKGATVNPEEVKDYVAKRVANYKKLGYVQYIDKIPKNASGKILRKELQNI